MRRAITAALLADLYTGHKANFRSGFAGVKPNYLEIATEIPSSAASETYSWLGEWPRIREWFGDRVVQQLSASTYTVKNRSFETTVSVNRDNIEDDQLGIYAPMFQELGRATGVFPDELVYGLLGNGTSEKCYDGQPFFDDEHKVAGVSVSNLQDGNGPGWYLLDTSRALKPLIYQNRRPFDFVALDDARDQNVVMRKEFIYGSDGRCNSGFGFWQMAHASFADLTSENLGKARAAMGGYKSDAGRPLGVVGGTLVVGPSLEGPANKLATAEQINGSDNEWRGRFKVVLSPYLD